MTKFKPKAVKTCYKIGDTVTADTYWADNEFPNVDGVVTELRHGGNVVVFETMQGRSPRSLHVSYLL